MKQILLNDLIGKSFHLLDGTIAVIYMLFDSLPQPFFLVKRRGESVFVQISATDLIEILEINNMQLIN